MRRSSSLSSRVRRSVSGAERMATPLQRGTVLLGLDHYVRVIRRGWWKCDFAASSKGESDSRHEHPQTTHGRTFQESKGVRVAPVLSASVSACNGDVSPFPPGPVESMYHDVPQGN